MLKYWKILIITRKITEYIISHRDRWDSNRMMLPQTKINNEQILNKFVYKFIQTYIIFCSNCQGDQCQNEINECISNPCQNGAICNNLISGYNCTCSSGYNGTLCQTDTDECRSNPCLHQGTCQDMVDSYVCMCAQGFTGKWDREVSSLRC